MVRVVLTSALRQITSSGLRSIVDMTRVQSLYATEQLFVTFNELSFVDPMPG